MIYLRTHNHSIISDC